MKRLFYFSIVMTAIQYNTFAQTKPELPPDFFDKFSYTLPAGFNYNDSAQLLREVKKIAAELIKWDNRALDNYSISDSTVSYYFLDGYSAENALLGNDDKAIESILQCRQLRPSPDYVEPFRLFLLAYCKACFSHPNDGSLAFRSIYAKILNEEFNKINPSFRKDIVNRSKGLYTAAYTEINWNNLKQELDQSINKSSGKLDHMTATSLLAVYLNYYLRKNYQPLIEEALYFITPSKVKEQQVKIPLRDGVKLNAYMYNDMANPDKLPAIISLSPYPSGSEATKGNVFATNGYIYVYVDTRGRRESEGSFMPYEDDARDFYDIIDWVSKQPWCDGKVATSGGSYLGFDQWQAIRKEYKHPALKAINPMVAVGFGVDFPRSGNMFYPYILQWATYVSGKELNQALFNDSKFWNDKEYALYKNRIPFAKFDSVAGMSNAIFQKWISHPDFDSYWQGILPTKEDYAALDIPVFSITGYYDADQNGSLYYYNQHQKYASQKARDRHILLIGPYEHGGAQWAPNAIQSGIEIEKEAQIPIYKYVIWWFDWVLKGKQKPAFIKDNITYFETGTHKWKGSSSFNKITTDSLELYLTPNIVSNKQRNDVHALTLQKPGDNASVKYTHDISLAIDSAFLFASQKPFDDSLYMASKYNLIFESTPLEKNIVISDKIIARLYTKLNVPDADFELSIEEISPDGKDRNLAYASLRARYRNGGESPQLVNPGEPVQLNFDNAYVYIKKINKGNKIRLIFQSINNPWEEKNYGFGGEVSKEGTEKSRVIEATILTGKNYPSKVVMPYTTD